MTRTCVLRMSQCCARHPRPGFEHNSNNKASSEERQELHAVASVPARLGRRTRRRFRRSRDQPSSVCFPSSSVSVRTHFGTPRASGRVGCTAGKLTAADSRSSAVADGPLQTLKLRVSRRHRCVRICTWAEDAACRVVVWCTLPRATHCDLLGGHRFARRSRSRCAASETLLRSLEVTEPRTKMRAPRTRS